MPAEDGSPGLTQPGFGGARLAFVAANFRVHGVVRSNFRWGIPSPRRARAAGSLPRLFLFVGGTLRVFGFSVAEECAQEEARDDAECDLVDENADQEAEHEAEEAAE